MDFHRFYGVDFADGVLERRSARWFMWRLHCLGAYDESLFARLCAHRAKADQAPPPADQADDDERVILG